MPGYLVANVDVHDPALFEEYRKQVPAILAAHGGRYIVRGATLDHVEGKLKQCVEMWVRKRAQWNK